MKTKFLLPVLAMIFATGMSFTTVNMTQDPTKDYIFVNNQWMPIQEIDCGQPSSRNCEVQLPDGSIHQVYDTNSFATLKKTGSGVPFKL